MIVENVEKSAINHEVVTLSCHAFGIITHFRPYCYNPFMPLAFCFVFLTLDSH